MTEITPELWKKNWDAHIKEGVDYSTEEHLGVLYRNGMAEYPEKTACWMMKREIKYKELLDNVEKFATFLQENGLKKGDVVGICLANSPQYLIAHFGTLLAGCVASGCSPLLSEDEIAYQLNDSGAKVFVTLDAIYEHRLTKILDEVPKLEIVVTTNISDYMGLSKLLILLGKYVVKKIPHGKVTEWPGKKVVDFRNIMNTTSINVKPVDIDIKNDLALMQYTGGTTGFPKGTELTHYNLIAQHTQIGNWTNFTPTEDILLSGFPMFHAAGITLATQAVWWRSSQVLIPNPRDAENIIEEITDKSPTMIVNVPTLFLNVMNSPKSKYIPQEVLDNVKIFVSGAAPFPPALIRDFEKHMRAENKVLEVYGMTEASPLITANPYFGNKKVGTVGLVFPDTDVKLVDPETGETVGVGEPGEILARGPQVTRGYHNKPEETAATIDKDGWLHTGDVGVMDEDGYITIVDRVKDMLIVSGFKVYSVHVEDVLTKHPDIELAAIIGLPDETRPGSEIVKCFIKLKGGIEPTEAVKKSIRDYSAESLSKYENPRIWEFREDLPLTAVGKILKRDLRETT